MQRHLIWLVLPIITACSFDGGIDENATIRCTEASHCPEPLVCILEQERCLPKTGSCIEEVDGNYVPVADGNQCSVSTGEQGSCSGGVCAVCGNGVREGNETCDEGSNSPTCDADCTIPICGDNVHNEAAGEMCDDGNTLDGDYCAADCADTTGYCGDSFLQQNESCDDGNDLSDDGCSAVCQVELGFSCQEPEVAADPSVCIALRHVWATAVGPGDGLSWQTAYPALQDALSEAANITGDVEIWVAEGAYLPDDGIGYVSGDRDASFVLQNNVAIYGGFAGFETARHQRYPQVNETVLHGDLFGDDDADFAHRQDNSRHVVRAGEEVGATGVIDGFVIEAGNANGLVEPGDVGGGLYNLGSPTISHCVFRDNLSNGNGGAMHNAGDMTAGGGGVSNCEFQGNRSRNGGGLFNGGDMTLTDCLFSDNYALSEGGGLFGSNRTVVINTVFLNNGSSASAGALWGGGIVECSRCQFLANLSGGDGGAVENTYEGTMRIVNSIMVGNRSPRVAAIWNLGILHLVNSTLVGNVSEVVGTENSLIHSCPQSGHEEYLELNVHNSILWGNDVVQDIYWSDSGNQQIVIETSITSPAADADIYQEDGTLVTSGHVADCTDADPLFLRGPDPGPEGWGDDDDDFGDLRLQQGSPAIDHGDNSDMLQVGQSLEIDLAGEDRVTDVLGGGDIVDMGAYERLAPECGDGTIDGGEICDDGNKNDGDGCSSSCAVDAGFNCTGAPSICTTTFYVDAAATGANDGSSWESAFVNLQDALATTEGKTYRFEIWVADGTYYPDRGTGQTLGDRTATFELPNGVALYGGFAGDETERGERVVNGNGTILSGDIGAPDVDTDNSHHVVTANGVDRSAVLDNFLITRGHADGAGTYGSVGGGLNSISSDMVVANTVFLDNFSEGSGGGMHNNGSTNLIINCSFLGNVSNWWGGGMHNNASPVVVVNSVFSGNTAKWGGGMGAFNHSDARVSSCSFGFNDSTQAFYDNIYIGRSDLVISNTVAWNGGIGANSTPTADTRNNVITVNASHFIDADGGDDTFGTLDDDFRLAADSSALNCEEVLQEWLEPDAFDLDGDGDTSEKVPHDRDGNTRVVGTLDAGAYETQ